MAETTDKQKLISDLAEARVRMQAYGDAVRHDFDVGARLKSSVARNSTAWYAGSALLGLLLSKIPPLRRKVVVEKRTYVPASAEKAGKLGLVLSALKFAAQFAKPAFIFWTKRRAR